MSCRSCPSLLGGAESSYLELALLGPMQTSFLEDLGRGPLSPFRPTDSRLLVKYPFSQEHSSIECLSGPF